MKINNRVFVYIKCENLDEDYQHDGLCYLLRASEDFKMVRGV